MMTIFSFFEVKQVLAFQAINKFMYHRGVGRVQIKLKMRRPGKFFYYFSYPFTKNKVAPLLAYDPVT